MAVRACSGIIRGGDWLCLSAAAVAAQLAGGFLSSTRSVPVFLLEHEIARGTTRLYFEGGTPHAMRFAFTSTETTDVLAMRRWSLRAWMLRRFACSILPEKNFLRSALRDDEMKCA